MVAQGGTVTSQKSNSAATEKKPATTSTVKK
jgi:hypothetical protein